MRHKTLVTLSTVISLCISLNCLFAQPAQYRAQVDQIRSNQFMQLQNQMMMMQMLNMRWVQSSPEEYDFVVTLRDSTKKEVTSAMYADSVSKKRFIIFVDKKYKKSDTNRYKKIYPAQTINIQREIAPVTLRNTAPRPSIHFVGKATDSCWMFQTISGSITAYSYSCDYYNIDVLPIAGIQLNNGPILNFTRENLWQMIISDQSAVDYFKYKDYRNAIIRYNKDVAKAAKAAKK